MYLSNARYMTNEIASMATMPSAILNMLAFSATICFMETYRIKYVNISLGISMISTSWVAIETSWLSGISPRVGPTHVMISIISCTTYTIQNARCSRILFMRQTY